MSLNLHDMVRSAIGVVNSDIAATLRRSTGYTTAAGGVRTPTYADTTGRIQPQPLSASQLKHMNDLNIQGVLRKVYMYGDWGGPIRADKTGGDLLVFPRTKNGPAVTWKIAVEIEAWNDSGWCCVGVVLQ